MLKHLFLLYIKSNTLSLEEPPLKSWSHRIILVLHLELGRQDNSGNRLNLKIVDLNNMCFNLHLEENLSIKCRLHNWYPQQTKLLLKVLWSSTLVLRVNYLSRYQTNRIKLKIVLLLSINILVKLLLRRKLRL